MLKINYKEKTSFNSYKKSSLSFAGNIKPKTDNLIQFPGLPDTKRPIVIVTDAWEPQINGVVTDMKNLRNSLRELGYKVVVITPDKFKKIPSPDPNIQLAIGSGNYSKMKKILNKIQPQSVFIATEGPLGFYTQKICKNNNWPYSTHYASKFPEFLDTRYKPQIKKLHNLFGVPENSLLNFTYNRLKAFHLDSAAVIVKTQSVLEELTQKGFKNLKLWAAACVDTKLFNPSKRDETFIPQHINPALQPKTIEEPITEYMGRVAPEKGIEKYLELKIPGTKMVVGPGSTPEYLNELINKYPEVIFTGPKRGEDLAKHVARAKISFFSSITDTLGLTMPEFNAAGVPVVAYNVTGPKDIYALSGGNKAAVLCDDLAEGFKKALKLKPEDCRKFAETHFSPERCAINWLTLQARIPEQISQGKILKLALKR